MKKNKIYVIVVLNQNVSHCKTIRWLLSKWDGDQHSFVLGNFVHDDVRRKHSVVTP